MNETMDDDNTLINTKGGFMWQRSMYYISFHYSFHLIICYFSNHEPNSRTEVLLASCLIKCYYCFFLSLSQRDQRFYVNFCFDQIRHDNPNKMLIMSINIVNDQQKIKGTLSFMEESSNRQIFKTTR